MIKTTILAVMAVFYITYFAKQIAQRKQGVEGAFGKEYADYKKRVRRYL